MNATNNPRRHDIDAIRVLAFAVLILYHIGMFYVADWDWHVKSRHSSEALQLPMLLVNQWRMHLIFLVSGIATSFLLAKQSVGRFAATRTRRLLVPLLFGMAVIVMPQAYYEALYRGAIEPGIGSFVVAYFTFQPWPAGAFAGSEIGITWNHLWYLPYLLFYTLILAALTRWIPGLIKSIRQRFQSQRGAVLFLAPAGLLMLYGWFLFPVFGGVNHTLVTDWYAHAMFFSFFAFGFCLAADAGIWAEIGRLRWPSLFLAIAAFSLMQLPDSVIPASLGLAAEALETPTIMLNRWFWILAVLGWSYRYLNRPWPWLAYANEAVYPWYILHQTLIVWIGYQLGWRALGPVSEPLVVIVFTLAACAVLHEYLIRRLAWLRPLFGLKPAPLSGPRGQ